MYNSDNLLQDPKLLLKEMRKIVKEEIALSQRNKTITKQKTHSPFVKIDEVCTMLNVSKTTIYKWEQKGYISKYKLNSRTYFNKEEILEFLKNQKE